MTRIDNDPARGLLSVGALVSIGLIVIVLTLAIRSGHPTLAILVAGAGIAGAATVLIALRSLVRLRVEIARMTRLAGYPDAPIDPSMFRSPEVARLAQAWPAPRDQAPPRPATTPGSSELTGSGLLDGILPDFNALSSTDFTQGDMIAKLEPQSLRWISASPALTHLLGWTETELRERSFPEIILEDDRELAREQLLAAEIKGEAHGLIYRILAADGSQKIVELHVGIRFVSGDHKPRYVRLAILDVTAKVKAGRELRRRTRELTRANNLLRQTNGELAELKDRYTDLYQNAPALYFSLDDRGRFQECNQTLLDALGYQRKELIDRPYCATILDPDRRPGFPDLFERLRLHGHLETEARWQRADGRSLEVSIQSSAIRDQDGRILTARCVARDVSSYKRLEATLLERNHRLAGVVAELRRKNRELDEFTYGVSHDLQEPLRTLTAFSDFLLTDYGDRLDDAGREYVHHLVKASRRMKRLIEDLLSLSKAGRVTAAFHPVDLGEVVENCRADLAQLLRERQGTLLVHGPLPHVWGDRARLEQLLTNLISNGLKYQKPGIPPVVEIFTRADDDPESSLILAVRDHGIGIDPQFHEKIFQLFRRLHAGEHEGTGAGLAICRKIVQAHRGVIEVQSEPNMGATFLIHLPGTYDPDRRPAAPEAAHV